MRIKNSLLSLVMLFAFSDDSKATYPYADTHEIMVREILGHDGDVPDRNSPEFLALLDATISKSREQVGAVTQQIMDGNYHSDPWYAAPTLAALKLWGDIQLDHQDLIKKEMASNEPNSYRVIIPWFNKIELFRAMEKYSVNPNRSGTLPYELLTILLRGDCGYAENQTVRDALAGLFIQRGTIGLLSCMAITQDSYHQTFRTHDHQPGTPYTLQEIIDQIVPERDLADNFPGDNLDDVDTLNRQYGLDLMTCEQALGLFMIKTETQGWIHTLELLLRAIRTTEFEIRRFTNYLKSDAFISLTSRKAVFNNMTDCVIAKHFFWAWKKNSQRNVNLGNLEGYMMTLPNKAMDKLSIAACVLNEVALLTKIYTEAMPK